MSDMIAYAAGHRLARVDPQLETSRKKTSLGVVADTNTAAGVRSNAGNESSHFVTKNGSAIGHKRNLAQQFEKDHHEQQQQLEQQQPQQRRKASIDNKNLLTSDPAEVKPVVGKKQTAFGAASRTTAAPFASTGTASTATAAIPTAAAPVVSAAKKLQSQLDHFDSYTSIPAKGASSPPKARGPKHMNGAPAFVVDHAEASAILGARRHHIHTVADARGKQSSIGGILSQDNVAAAPFPQRATAPKISSAPAGAPAAGVASNSSIKQRRDSAASIISGQ